MNTPTPDPQISHFSGKSRVACVFLLIVILIGVLFRTWGLGWGIPDILPPEATTCRNSFHLDEDDYLRGVAKIEVRNWNFDVRDYHWGTLQFYLIGCALKAASLGGYLTRPWQESFVNLDPREFYKIYIVGRTVSALSGMLSLFLIFQIGKKLNNSETGLLAAAFFAVAPLHVVNSHFLTSDVTMVFLLLGSLYFFLSSLEHGGIRIRTASGFLLGLAIAAKYNAAFLLPLWIGGDMIDRPQLWRTKFLGYAAIITGFLLGEPYALIHPREVINSISKGLARTDAIRPFLLSWPDLLFKQTEGIAEYALTWTLAIPAAVGLILWFRRHSHKTFGLGISVLLIAASLIAAKWPMIRYTLPLIPIGALAAAHFVAGLPIQLPARLCIGIVACLLPVSISWAQLKILLAEHPANQAARWIGANIPPGSRIGQIWPEVPPLDAHCYNLRMLHGLFPWDPAEPPDLDRQYLVLDNLPIQAFSKEFIERLKQNYILVAEFRSDPKIGPWTLSEKGAPHDWKYTHPVMRIYAKTASAYP